MRRDASTAVLVLLCVAVGYLVWKIHVISQVLQPVINAVELIKGFLP
jgi:hypothetical protein